MLVVAAFQAYSVDARIRPVCAFVRCMILSWRHQLRAGRLLPVGAWCIIWLCVPSGLTGRYVNWTRNRRLQGLRLSKPFSRLMMSLMLEACARSCFSFVLVSALWPIRVISHTHHGINCFLGNLQLLATCGTGQSAALNFVK